MGDSLIIQQGVFSARGQVEPFQETDDPFLVYVAISPLLAGYGGDLDQIVVESTNTDRVVGVKNDLGPLSDLHEGFPQ